jgi:hypothetical protein
MYRGYLVGMIDDTRPLMRSKLTDRHSTGAGLEQRMPSLVLAALPTVHRKLLGLATNPRLAGRLAAMGMGRDLSVPRQRSGPPDLGRRYYPHCQRIDGAMIRPR